jgi:hypothetical protein
MAPVRRRSRGIGVLISWSFLGFPNPSESDLIAAATKLNRLDALVVLIRLLRMADSGKTAATELLNLRVPTFSQTTLGIQVTEAYKQGDTLFLNKWQLLFSIKVVCLYSRDETPSQDAIVPPDDLYRLLLLVNDFVYRDFGRPSELSSESEQWTSLKGSLIKQAVLFSREQPRYLVGRYNDLFFSSRLGRELQEVRQLA